jgi:hypothetical protein
MTSQSFSHVYLTVLKMLVDHQQYIQIFKKAGQKYQFQVYTVNNEPNATFGQPGDLANYGGICYIHCRGYWQYASTELEENSCLISPKASYSRSMPET